jgi:2-(1,2-epoxy-1,2-dihydrophenyl)acetyl-CoA isomerase
MDEPIIQSLEGGLLTITINRPERRNALDSAVALDLLAAVQRGAEDQAVRAVLLRGAGGTFCVGGDVKAMADPTAVPPGFETKTAMIHRRMEIARLLHEMAKPVVAAIDGAAAGAGLSFALACDFRVVGENAKLATAFARIGVSGDYGGIYFLTKMFGGAKARELYMLGKTISGREAHGLGLATELVADADVQPAAERLARSLAEGPTVSLGYIKQNINNAEEGALSDYLKAEAMHHGRCLQTADYKEAAAAFVEKRPPNFQGR